MLRNNGIYFVIFLLCALNVSAAPVFVKHVLQNPDNVYGGQDRFISFTSYWNQGDLIIIANFSSIETASSNTSRNGEKMNGNIYSIQYTINQSGFDGTYLIPVTATDPDDNSSFTAFFNLSIDNTAPNISGENYKPLTVFNVTPVTLNATITDLHTIIEVNVSGSWPGNFANFSILNMANPFYIISASFIQDNETIFWRYYAKDNANNVAEGILQIIAVTQRTQVTLIPSEPNGCNNWYVTEPFFTLQPDTGRTGHYRFDSLENHEFSTPFNHSGIPGGHQILNYWSNDSGNNLEPSQSTLFQIDITPPLITNLKPANGSIVSDLRPMIEARFDEIYFDNAGIDASSIVMKLDTIDVTPEIEVFNQTLEGIMRFRPGVELTPGNHSVEIFIKDLACLNSTKAWTFSINDTIPFINLSFPPDHYLSPISHVPFQITVSPPSRLSYIIDEGPERSLCTSCTAKNKNIRFEEGNHSVTVKATNTLNGAVSTKNISLFVDYKAPKIKKVFPKDHNFGFGLFNISYSEDFLERLTLFYRGPSDPSYYTSSLGNCSAGKDQSCSVDVDLSSYDNLSLTYYFTVEDLFRNASSKIQTVFVDLTEPDIIIHSPIPVNYTSTNLMINVSTSEVVKSLKYADTGDRFSSLCSRCEHVEKTKKFYFGEHTLTFLAEDFAGHITIENVSFSILSP